MEHTTKYLNNIFQRYTNLKKSNKQIFDNNDLCKIFEFYTCIKLSEELKRPVYEYDDIDPIFKELNKMTRNDTGIDCCDLIDTIIQCKLRKNTLTWYDCATFFGSQVIFDKELKKQIIRWNNLIIARNNDCILSKNLLERSELFIDKTYSRDKLIEFCEYVIKNPPNKEIISNDFKLRDYQIESINLIKENNKNVIINLPTGTGKNTVIIYSIQDNLKYLILVPRIILMEQLKNEIIKYKPNMINDIQLIGDNNNIFNETKLITICVFNSVHLIENYCINFNKIYIDEAHHINKPAIYYEIDENYENYEDEIDENNLEYNIKKYSKYTKKQLFNELFCELSDDHKAKIIKYLNLESIYDLYNEDEYVSDDDIDSEDELVNIKNYTEIIKSLVKYNNNIYLSATIDSTENFEYYSQDIRKMIDLKYLCDYTIHVPIFNDDITNKNICKHLLKNYISIIIYCNTQKEGKQINKLMNELQLNSSEYIDCNTPKKLRNNIIEKYKKGKIAFLVNVRILVEGFDAPITNGVCFLHLPTNKTTLIQIIGRCLRLYPTKTFANIILPFSSKEDEKHISNFLKVMAKNDTTIRQSYENKQLGGYISIEKIIDCNEEDNNNNDVNDENKENNDIEFKFNMIYNSMGTLQNGVEIWTKRFDDSKQYIDTNNKRPSKYNKNKEIKQLGNWLSTQRTNYKKKIKIMSNNQIYNIWTEFINNDKYKKYIQTNEDSWYDSLNQVIEYINLNNKRPSTTDKDTQIKQLGSWICLQKKNYRKKIRMMSNSKIYNQWTQIINNINYKTYFQDLEDDWYDSLNKVKQFMDTNNKRPSQHDTDIQIKQLGTWLSTQQQNYKKKEHIMSNEIIYNTWINFKNCDKYITYFETVEDKWNNSYNKVIEYMDLNNKRPSTTDKDEQVRQLGSWICTNHKKYKKTQILHLMKNGVHL